jgi:hypothetical protein
MSATKIQIGYGSDQRGSKKKGLYGKKSSGKYMANGGFSGEPVSDFHSISDEVWVKIFGTNGMPSWKKELYDKGELFN